MIELKNVCKTYVVGDISLPALKNVSLSVEKGEMLALTGASGSGKSTLMNILGCLDRPTSGEYFLDGVEVGRLGNDGRAEMRNRKIGFVFQSFNLLPRTSALENVIMPLSYTASRMGDREALERGRAMLELVGLKDRMLHEPSQLSGGQQQRVAIARALVNNPEILFADEPTGNLDSRMSAEIMDMFARINSSGGVTVVLVTHEPEIAAKAKRVVKVVDGEIASDKVLR
ncbi:MAG: ABC transporter ATP-binding protein [Opitutales bacterium]|nr:ABC transporter ATP-binding protein [Opitutales bacterium]